MKLSLGILVFLVLFAASPAAAADDGTWVLLGRRTVSLVAERDVIVVTAWEGRFDALQLRVERRGIHMIDLKIHYGNGGTQDVVIRTHIPAGGKTRVIDLGGADRVVKKVTMTYRTRARLRGPATVSLFGRRVSGVAVKPEPKPVPTTVPKWVVLGSRRVNFATDKDVIPVTGAEGKFTKLKLEVLEKGIEILDVKVFFGNGTFLDVPVRTFIRAGGQTRELNLPGDDRVVNRVSLLYRTRGVRVGRALVKLWGLKMVPVVVEAPKPEPKPKPKPKPVVGVWVKLGSRKVAARTDRDAIPVTATAGRFRKIQLRVGGKAIEILDLKIHFGDGTFLDATVRARIPAGGHTRDIDLPGDDRVINRVSILYRHLGRLVGQPTVSVWGKR